MSIKYNYLLSLFTLMISVTNMVHADAYSVEDMINHFNLIDEAAQEFEVKDCQQIPWLQKGLCDEIKENVTSKLAEISPYIGDNALIYRDLWNGSKKYGSKTYVTKTDLLLYVDGSTSISFDNSGLAIDDVFYPYIARFYLNAGASGDGDGHVKNKECVVPKPKPFRGCIKEATYSDNFDIDFFGNVELDVIAGLATNAKVIETEDEYILVLQPKFRLLPRESTVNIDYDVDGLNIFTTIANLIDIGDSTFDLSIDLAQFDFDSAINEFISLNESGLIALTSTTVFADDITGDSISHMASEITSYFADAYLDAKTARVLYREEKAVNDEIAEKLGLDSHGLVAYYFPKSKIHGRAIAELLPALTLLL